MPICNKTATVKYFKTLQEKKMWKEKKKKKVCQFAEKLRKKTPFLKNIYIYILLFLIKILFHVLFFSSWHARRSPSLL